MNRWESSLYYQRQFAPDLWPSVIMVQKLQISDAQIMTLKTSPVLALVGPPGYMVFPERVVYFKPASPGAYSGNGTTGNIQVFWPDNNSVSISQTTAGLLDLAAAGWGLGAQPVFTVSSPSGLVGLGYNGKNDGITSNFQRVTITFATANPTVSGGGFLNVVLTYRLWPFVPAFP